MNVKLTGGIAGDRFSYKPRQVIKCSERTGARLIADGGAIEAPPGAEVEGELFDQTAEDKASQTRKPAPEKGVKPKPETPEARDEAAACKGTTTMGNDCKKVALPGKKFCARHLEAA